MAYDRLTRLTTEGIMLALTFGFFLLVYHDDVDGPAVWTSLNRFSGPCVAQTSPAKLTAIASIIDVGVLVEGSPVEPTRSPLGL